MEELQCKKCKETKSLDNFYLKSGKKTHPHCKVCVRAQAKAWKANNIDRCRETNKKWNSNNYSKKRYRELKQKYNTTPEHYDEMLTIQNHSCKICGIHQDKLNRKLAIDHCHITGKIRGLLCLHCNALLGYCKDKVDLLDRAKAYLTS